MPLAKLLLILYWLIYPVSIYWPPGALGVIKNAQNIVSTLLKSLHPSWENKTYNMEHIILLT